MLSWAIFFKHCSIRTKNLNNVKVRKLFLNRLMTHIQLWVALLRYITARQTVMLILVGILALLAPF